jgi:hypothetical protein
MNEKVKGIGNIHLGHVLSLDPSTIRTLLESTGFEIIDVYVDGLPALTPAMAVICRVNEDKPKLSIPSSTERLKKIEFFNKNVLMKNDPNKKEKLLSYLLKFKKKIRR